jgi:hypothetical protein
MNVDVNLLRRHLKIKEDYGIRSRRENIAVGLRECMEDELVPDQALIDEDIDRVAIELLQLGFGDEASEAKETGVGCNVVLFALPGRGLRQTDASEVKFGRSGEHVVAGLSAKDLEEAVCAVANSGGYKESLRGGVKFKVFCGVDEGIMRDERSDVRQLSLFGLEEFTSGGSIEEEVAESDGGADWKASIFDSKDISAGNFYEST